MQVNVSNIVKNVHINVGNDTNRIIENGQMRGIENSQMPCNDRIEMK